MNLYEIYFSATNNTKKIVNSFSENFNYSKKFEFNLANRNKLTLKFNDNDIVVVGMPSFGGRVPNIALTDLENLDGNNALTIAIVTYGARAYEDSLIELSDFLKKRNFRVIASIASVCKHSIVNSIASDRPNLKDFEELKKFSKLVKEKIYNNIFNSFNMPGNNSYKELKIAKLNIIVNENCNNCKYCKEVCPTNAISEDLSIDTTKCISCMRCVNACA